MYFSGGGNVTVYVSVLVRCMYGHFDPVLCLCGNVLAHWSCVVFVRFAGTSIMCCVCAVSVRGLRSCVVSLWCCAFVGTSIACVCVVCCYDHYARPRDSADLNNGLRAIHVSTLRRSAQAARVARGSIWLKCMQLVDHVFTLKAAGFPR